MKPTCRIGTLRLFLLVIVPLVCLALSIPKAAAQTYIFNQAQFGSGGEPVAVITADFNGDGLLDLAVVNRSDNTVSILLGKPDGTFAPQVAILKGTDPSRKESR